ncbi:MAG: glycoside hydrolase family 99-like domain-containing protein [Candidatus Sumerlaeota bacterium]|nr:glycoside hydrolase family 99-like domain-containing protein [Candidatus Sumerlaeota bacterium]
MRLPSLLACGVCVSALAFGEAPSGEVLAQWRFDSPESMRGWVPNQDWTGRIVEGHWSATIAGKDPILVGPVLDPPLEIGPRDCIELRCRGSQAGVLQVFFTNDITGKQGGFSEERSVRSAVPVAQDFRTIRLWPAWAAMKKLQRIRFDGPASGVLDLESIAIRRLPAPPNDEAEWDLRDASTAQRFRDSTFDYPTTPTAAGLQVAGADGPPVLSLDAVRALAEGRSWLVVKMSASSGPYGGFKFGTPPAKGGYYTFPIRADGRMHTYNVWMGDYDLVQGPEPQRPVKSKFCGVLNNFSIIPTYEPGAQGVVQSVAFRAAPEGPPLLVVEYCGPADGLYRVGRRGPIAIRVRNAGGSPAKGIRVGWQSDPGLKVEAKSLRGAPEAIPPDQVATLYADVTPQSAGHLSFTARLGCEGGEPVEATGRIRVDPTVNLPQGEIPPPKPLKTPYDIGVYYFPGWGESIHHWVTIPPFAERRPLLGFHDEASPIVADWTIKWAVEHGVNFFVLDWYWLKGQVTNGAFLEKGLLHSRFLPYIQWCVDWINHKPFGQITPKDWGEIVDYWIENYFPNPQYKRFRDGRPIVVVYHTPGFRQDLGAETVPRLLADADARAKKAGFPGIYWVAGNPDGDPAVLVKEGYEAGARYNYPGEGSGGFPTSPAWQHILGAVDVWNRMPKELTPWLPLSAGFDHRPWFGRSPMSCRYGLTPELFEKELRNAKEWLDAHGQKTLTIEAWNEWGEGSDLGPHAAYGFDLLEAIPRVFAPGEPPRPPVGPADVGVYAPEIAGIWTQVARPAFAPATAKQF